MLSINLEASTITLIVNSASLHNQNFKLKTNHIKDLQSSQTKRTQNRMGIGIKIIQNGIK